MPLSTQGKRVIALFKGDTKCFLLSRLVSFWQRPVACPERLVPGGKQNSLQTALCPLFRKCFLLPKTLDS